MKPLAILRTNQDLYWDYDMELWSTDSPEDFRGYKEGSMELGKDYDVLAANSRLEAYYALDYDPSSAHSFHEIILVNKDEQGVETVIFFETLQDALNMGWFTIIETNVMTLTSDDYIEFLQEVMDCPMNHSIGEKIMEASPAYDKFLEHAKCDDPKGECRDCILLMLNEWKRLRNGSTTK